MPSVLRTLLVILCCLGIAPLHGAETNGDWLQSTSTLLQDINRRLPDIHLEEDAADRLSGWQTALGTAKELAEKCVEQNTQLTAELKHSLEAIEATTAEHKGLERRLRDTEKRLVACQALLLDLRTAASRIKELQTEILTSYLLARSSSVWAAVLHNLQQPGEWLSNSRTFLEARMRLDKLETRGSALLAGVSLIGLLAGFWGRKKLLTLAGPGKDGEITSQLISATCACLGKRLPLLLLLSGASLGITASIGARPLPLSLALLISMITYLLASTVTRILLKPCPPASHVLNLEADYATALHNRLQSLLLLGLLVVLFYGIDLKQAYTPAQWQIGRAVFLSLVIVNLLWLLIFLNRAPGLLGSQVFRTIGFLGLIVTLVSEFLGYRNLSMYVLTGMLGSTLLGVSVWLMNALLQDTLDGLDEGRLAWQRRLRHQFRLGAQEPMPGLLLLRLLSTVLVWVTFFIGLVRLWGYPARDWAWLQQAALSGFEIGTIRIVPLQWIMALAVFALLINLVRRFKSETLPHWLRRTTFDHGAREAVISISGYAGFIIAALVGLSLAGFSFTNLAIIAGALSVGIGFGMQNIVNNFISGIILLFERPIRTGDWIVVGSTEGYVRKISIRSTQIETFDRADVIVPNSELISNQVTNWMLRDPWGRIIVPIGVAYGSDVDKVREILLAAARQHELIIKDDLRVAPPRVLFRGFGDSSLNFELRCFIRTVDQRLNTISDLNYAIEKGLREAGIEIPFPQRDLHLRSIDPGIRLSPGKPD